MMFKFLAIFVACLCVVQSQVPIIGECPEVTVLENFDLNKYLGKWYEQKRYGNLFELLGQCNTAEYSLNENGTVNVHNTQINKLSGALEVIDGNAVPAGDITEAKFLVDFPNKGVHPNAPYWVLDTDYESYSVVWSCTKLHLISVRFVWLLTREKDCSADVLDKMNDVLDKFHISKLFLQSVDQSNCS